MRPTFMGFESATRGLMASQKALDIVGNNVGNIGVTGYTRQRVDMVSLANNSATARYAQNPTGKAGQGVMVTGISQVRDPFLDKRFREEYADVGYYQTMNSILGDIEDSLNEVAPSTMTNAIDTFKNAWLNMQKNGTNDVSANAILSSAKTLTQVFKQLDSKLESVWSQQKYDLEINVDNVNSILTRIANLNEGIAKEMLSMNAAGSSSSMPNELLDARNVLLDELSQYGDIQTRTMPDGTITVMMGTDNHVVVEGNRSDEMVLSKAKNQNVVAVRWQTTGENIATSTGSLRASIDLLNGRGSAAKPAMGEGFDKGILYYQDKINSFAKTLAGAFNNVLPEYDTNGNKIGTKQLFVFTGDGEANAKNISINKTWESKPSYVYENIFAPGEGSDSNSAINKAYALFEQTLDFGEYKGTFLGYTSFYTDSVGNQVTHSTSRLESCADLTDKILNSISAVSGVSLEEEGVDMVQYTKAYNAMGRVMTALDEALDTLINKVGLVGR